MLVSACSFVLFGAVSLTAAGAHKSGYHVTDLGAGTAVVDIASDGSVIGYSSSNGFLRAPDGTMTTFSAPGACATYPEGITKTGAIVGRANVDGSCESEIVGMGFIRASDGTIATFTGLDGWEYMIEMSMDQKGRIVGIYQPYGAGGGAFVRRPDGTIKVFAPFRNDPIVSIRINDKGTIMGAYAKDGSRHGFVQTPDGTLTTFDVPGSTETVPYAMDDKGWIVGLYGPDQKLFFRAPDGALTLTDFVDEPNCINNSQRVSGKLQLPQYASKYAFVLGPGGKPHRIAMPLEQIGVDFACINEAGIVAGTFTQGFLPRTCCHFWEDHGFIAYPNGLGGRVGMKRSGKPAQN
jgi:hypothetical protein